MPLVIVNRKTTEQLRAWSSGFSLFSLFGVRIGELILDNEETWLSPTLPFKPSMSTKSVSLVCQLFRSLRELGDDSSSPWGTYRVPK
jgi:hypothetical protein